MINHLSKDARQVLDRYKVNESPTAGDMTRLLRTIEARGALGDVCRFEVQTSLAQLPASNWWAQMGSVTLGKLALGVLALALPVGAWLTLANPAPRSPEKSVASALSAVAPPAPIEVTAPPVPVVPTTSASATPPVDVAVPHSRAASSAGVASSSRSAPETVDGEVRLLNAAQSALRAGDASQALRLLDEDAQRFPSGKLVDARAVTRMLALCQLGRGAAARQEAERFLASHPDSPFVDRVRNVCAAKEPR